MDDDLDNVRQFRSPGMEAMQEPKNKTKAQIVRGDIMQRARRRHRILELRAAGLSEEQIAIECDVSMKLVSSTIRKQLEEWQEDDKTNVENIRQMKLYELDQLKRAVWAKALRGDDKAVNTALKIVQAQAKIAGADNPPQEPAVPPGAIQGIDPKEIERLERAWLHSSPDADKVVDAEIVEDVTQEQLPLQITDHGEFN